MGSKRPFDDEEFQEFSYKHSKQHDCCNKLSPFAVKSPFYEDPQKTDVPGEAKGTFCKLQFGDGLGNKSALVVSDLADKEFENSAPLSWVTSNTSEEDAGSGEAFCSHHFPEYFEFNFPRRAVVQFEDTYSSLLNSSPRKEVPVGSNHQADVPVWDPQLIKEHILSSNDIIDDKEDKVLGARLIPMPDSELYYHGVKVGDGRSNCGCPDEGSNRCVRHHVQVARERLRETLGHEKFEDLGFSDMGEEVAHKWTAEEERMFLNVVYSNPVSLCKNFWEQLRVMFPSRTKMELVSYYFNVFMLRKRAIQNRTKVLETDSDNDEWQGNDEGFFGVAGDDQDSEVESFVDHDESPDEYDNDNDDENNDDDNDDGDEQVGVADVTKKDGGSGYMSKTQFEKSHDDDNQGLMVHDVAKIPGIIKGKFDVQVDSCTSFEDQPYMFDFCSRHGVGSSIQESRANDDHGKCLHGNNNGLGSGYVLEHCDGKDWEAAYSRGLMESVDLLSTCNMIEEIFGSNTWNSKSSIEDSIS